MKDYKYSRFFKYQTILQIINLPWRSSFSWRMISCSFLFFLLFLIAKPFDSRPNFWQVTTMALCEMLNVSFFHLKVSITGQCRQLNVIIFTRMLIARNDFHALFTIYSQIGIIGQSLRRPATAYRNNRVKSTFSNIDELNVSRAFCQINTWEQN